MMPAATGVRRTHSKLDGDREEVTASLLGNVGASRDTRKVYKCRLNQALLTLDSLQQLLGETIRQHQYASHTAGYCPSVDTYRKPANAIESVAEPMPSLALTTSSPPN